MDPFRAWASVWGDSASVTGLAVSLVGFIVTVVAVLKSKSAATQAAEAARKSRDLLIRSSTIADFSAAVVSMQEIKRLHRAQAWPVLPDRYAALRERLIAIRSSNPGMNASQLAVIRGAEERFADLERRVDRMLADGSSPPHANKFNDIVSAELDKLHEVLTAVKQSTEA